MWAVWWVTSPSGLSLEKSGRGSRGGAGKSKKDLKKDDKDKTGSGRCKMD